jgi:hypothetical protein
MLTAAYHMLRNNVPYRDLGGDHFDQRDKRQTANRQIRRLGARRAYTVEVKAAARRPRTMFLSSVWPPMAAIVTIDGARSSDGKRHDEIPTGRAPEDQATLNR